MIIALSAVATLASLLTVIVLGAFNNSDTPSLVAKWAVALWLLTLTVALWLAAATAEYGVFWRFW